MCWPLRSLDLSILQKLRIGGIYTDEIVLSLLDTLFARGSFVNLTALTFPWIIFKKKMTLTNMPSLKFLALEECSARFPNLPLVSADDIKLTNFFGWIFGETEDMVPILAQIKGLELLHIKRCRRIMAMDEG